MRTKDGPTWFELFKANRALKKRLHKEKKRTKQYVRDTILLLEDLDYSEQERADILDKLKSMEKTKKADTKIVEKVVYLNKNSMFNPVMIHLMVFWFMNILFSNHLVSMGINDLHAVQFGLFLLNAIYICIVGYAMRIYDM